MHITNYNSDGYVLADAIKFVFDTTTNIPICLAKTPEQFTYDADGNLISDGLWFYIWNTENRLIQMQSLSSAPVANKVQIKFTYGYMGRQVQKQVYATSPTKTSKFIYDGWNVIAELSDDNSLLRS